MTRPRSQRHLLVQGGTVLTQDATRRVLEANILITDGVIAEVRPNLIPPSGTRLLAAEGMAIVPGFIQPRAALEHVLFRGLEHAGIGDVPHDDETAFWAARLGAVECLTSGITAIAGFEFPRGMDGMRRGLVESGIRTIFGGASEPGWDAFSRTDVDAEAWLDGLTRDNAELLRMGAKLGSIEAGKSGDVVVIDVRRPESFSHPDAPWPVRVRRSLDRAFIRWVVVDGEVLVDNGRLPHLDVERWTQSAEDAARKLLQRAVEKGN